MSRRTLPGLRDAAVFTACLACAFAAQGVWHTGMINDHPGGAGLGIGHFGGVAVDGGEVSPAGGAIFARYDYIGHAKLHLRVR